MKKFFTLLFTAAASVFSMAAADFQLYFGDQPVVNGATYSVGYKLEAEEEFKGNVYKTWYQDADLFLHGAVGTGVTIELNSSADVMICALDGNCSICKPGQTTTKSGYIRTDGESAEIHNIVETINDEDPAPLMKEIKLEVVAYATATPNEKTSVTVILTAEPQAGIGAINANKEYINMAAGNVLNYNVERPAVLNIYAITGNLVSSYPIANAGSVNLSALPKGIYIYTDGTHKGKIIVR